MEKDDLVASFFTKISHVRYQLASIGVTVDNDDQVQTVVNGLPSSWETFLSAINARENQPNFERLWHDCLQEERRIQSRNGSFNDENMALATNMKKRKRKKFSPRKKIKGTKVFESKLTCLR